jgi:hypothetical protein
MVGREFAMATAATNQPAGSRYNAAFGIWLQRHQFEEIDKGDRSRLLRLMDNRVAIEKWRGTLPESTRLRLNHPSSVWRRWHATTKVPKPKINPTLHDTVAAQKKEIDQLTARVEEAEAARELPVHDLGSLVRALLVATRRYVTAAHALDDLDEIDRQQVAALTEWLSELSSAVEAIPAPV